MQGNLGVVNLYENSGFPPPKSLEGEYTENSGGVAAKAAALLTSPVLLNRRSPRFNCGRRSS